MCTVRRERCEQSEEDDAALCRETHRRQGEMFGGADREGERRETREGGWERFFFTEGKLMP